MWKTSQHLRRPTDLTSFFIFSSSAPPFFQKKAVNTPSEVFSTKRICWKSSAHPALSHDMTAINLEGLIQAGAIRPLPRTCSQRYPWLAGASVIDSGARACPSHPDSKANFCSLGLPRMAVASSGFKPGSKKINAFSAGPVSFHSNLFHSTDMKHCL